jgi:hypothetical protein
MRLLPSDPDVETIVSRIKSGDINLQPEFQRGEVWPKAKKQRLIDSILRDWHVPPIHVIEQARSKKQEVLDGQQRLAAIRDFVDGQFPVDGLIEPVDPGINALHGRSYADLPEDWRRQFNQFTIRIFRIVDYRPTEPAELFFRLNQPASLTGAEQRNAFFGPVREQIKKLAGSLERTIDDQRFLAFSNARMAYDDVLARTALAVNRKSLAEKITAADLAALYRSEAPLPVFTVNLVDDAIRVLGAALKRASYGPKFNKATLFSWLIFLVRAAVSGNHHAWNGELPGFLPSFEEMRRSAGMDPERGSHLVAGCIPAARIFSIYETRSSARVADVSSVILRDAAIWLAFQDFSKSTFPGMARLRGAFDPADASAEDDILTRRLVENGWGELR